MALRRGSVYDILPILVIVMTLIIGVITSTLVLTEVKDATNDDQIDQDTLQKGIDALTIFDKGIILVFVGFFIFTIVTSIRIPSNPVFFIPALLFGSVTIWISATFSNILWQFMNVEPILTVVNNNYPTLVVFIENWPVVTAGLLFIVLIALYMKPQSRPEVGV